MSETSSTSTPESTPVDTSRPSTAPELTRSQRLTRIVIAAAVALAIIGTAWFVGERQGWSQIGTGGSNAQLLPKVGEPAPELVTLREDGTPMILSQLRGEPVWINFWGSWCPPCRAEMPDIQHAYETLAPQGLNILSISMQEEPAKAISYRDQVGATFPVYIDPAYVSSFVDAEANPELAAQMAKMHSDWQVYNFPTHIFIDENGIVQAVILSQMTYEEAVEYGEMVLYPDAAVRDEDAS
jgi:cytochrome c biogenesis protein CcmG, thiol:disulfide interchange protein DsbE